MSYTEAMIRQRRTVYVDSFGWPREKHGVHWSAIGVVTPREAETFARVILKCAKEARIADKLSAKQARCKHAHVESTWFEGSQERKHCLDCDKLWWD